MAKERCVEGICLIACEVVLVSAAERRCGRRDGEFDGGDGEPNGGDEIRLMTQPVFSPLIDGDRNLESSKLLDSLAQATEKVCTRYPST
jgi:hypothetical protein